jgi:uncharacterized protein YeeX (DUF496 family)
MAQGKTRKVNHRQIIVPENEWICVPGTHEAIISREVYDLVQWQISENSARDKEIRSQARQYTPNLFKGKIFCDQCGYAMHRSRDNKTGEYWFRCQSQWKYKKSACTLVSARENDILEAVLTEFKAHNSELITFALRLQKEAPQVREKQSSDDAEITELKVKLAQDTAFKQSLYESLVSEVITVEEYSVLKAEYEHRIDELRERVATIEKERREIEKNTTDGLDLFEHLRRVTVRNDITAELVDALVERITINPDKSAKVTLKTSVLEVVA